MADHKDTGKAQSSGQEENFKARRRLLKASAVVPLIGTLSPGAALAATSTQCDMDGNTFPPVVTADDKALRVQAVYWKAKPNNPANDMYQVGEKCYDAQSGQQIYPEFSRDGSRIKGYRNMGPRYVLCYVDVGRDPSTGDVTSQHIQITGFFPQQNTFGTAISDSCWDSIGGLQSIIYDQANG